MAHPHMLVDAQPYLKSIANNQIVINIKWYFDELTSEGFLVDYDENKNGILGIEDKRSLLKDFG